jgi:hypothetical protein
MLWQARHVSSTVSRDIGRLTGHSMVYEYVRCTHAWQTGGHWQNLNQRNALWHHWLRCVETDWSEQLGLDSDRGGGELYCWHPSMNGNDSAQQFYLGERSEAQSQRLASTAWRLISQSRLQSTHKALDSIGIYTWFTLMDSSLTQPKGPKSG